MRYLLDTHTYLWAQQQPSRIPSRVWEVLRSGESDLNLSVASLWEMTIKSRIGKLSLPGQTIAATVQSLIDLRVAVLTITPAHLTHLETLPLLHKDPFDRMLVAQASVEQMTLLTVDTRLSGYSIRHMWR